MYSRTTPTSDHDIKRAVLPYLPTDSKVIATASTRLYHAPFGSEPPNWTFSGLSGVLVFGRDRVRVHPDHRIGTGPGTSFEFSYWFRLIELRLSKGLVWMHQIPHHLDYRMDKPFFHVFLANVSPNFTYLHPPQLTKRLLDEDLWFSLRRRCGGFQVSQEGHQSYSF